MIAEKNAQLMKAIHSAIEAIMGPTLKMMPAVNVMGNPASVVSKIAAPIPPMVDRANRRIVETMLF